MLCRSEWRFRDLTLFVIAFALVWAAAVAGVWKFALLPEAVRPVFRTAVWCAAAAVWLKWQHTERPLNWLGLAPVSTRDAAFSVAAFAALFAWSVLRVQLIGPKLGRLSELSLDGCVWSLVGVWVEELMFRGVVQTKLAEEISVPSAVTLTALLFVAIHIPGWFLLAIPVHAGLVTTAFLIGIICGALRHGTGSLWPAVTAHWSSNLGALL